MGPNTDWFNPSTAHQHNRRSGHVLRPGIGGACTQLAQRPQTAKTQRTFAGRTARILGRAGGILDGTDRMLWDDPDAMARALTIAATVLGL